MIGSIVTTAKGHLQGTMENDICVWRGVRYAKAPIDALRFRSPEPVEKWSGVLDAVEFGAFPPQPSKGAGIGKMDEDCLFLNIWSPRADDNKRPVMVWIPGGTYISDAGTAARFSGQSLAKSGDVVVVSINYRIGALGFLDFAGESEEFETNLGLRDQVASLKWVKENIEVFGGDPENVTIFGELSGGSAVTTLLSVPSAKGLFQRAIADCPAPAFAVGKGSARKVSESFLQILGIGMDEIHRLKTIPVADIIAASSQFQHENAQVIPGSLLPFGPIVDGDFWPDYPLESIISRNTEGIPLLIGISRDDTPLFGESDFLYNVTNAGSVGEMHENTEPEEKEWISKAYCSFSEKETLGIGCDGTYHIPSICFAEAYSRIEKTWMYRCDHKTEINRLDKWKATPGLNRPFTFRTLGATLVKRIRSDRFRPTAHKASDRIRDHWVNFAKYGDPNPPEGEIWPKYKEANRYTMIFDKRDYIEKDPNGMIKLAGEGKEICK
ncbi:carboxylesterase/lipase family protein [Peribacillus sp. SI8-4]|uniref:carboxylesterase/lipase family protein n=1 Tax=Peribacillus sp. SI8-4 TaxID=3048009 RepID=UPI002553E551|nr:carboxylesterase/lipase family protein [Peribacillus sp. SI8-4]